MPLIEDTRVDGHLTLQLHAALTGFADGFAVLYAGLVECTGPSWGCSEIGSAQTGFAQSGFGNDFGLVSIYIGDIDHTFSAGNHLVLTVAVGQESTGDVWIEFGRESFPSRIVLQ